MKKRLVQTLCVAGCGLLVLAVFDKFGLAAMLCLVTSCLLVGKEDREQGGGS